MKKTIVTTLICMIVVAAVTVFGTLAYLTDRDSVTNTFTVGQVGITLDEADVDEDGKLILDEEGKPEERVKTNEYHLIPGQTYTKDPTITVEAGSEESYVRMILTVHNASTVQDIIDKYNLGDFSALIGGWDETTWLYKGFTEDKEANTISFEFRYKEIVSGDDGPRELDPLFETLIVPGDITGEELKALYDPDGNGDYADCFKMVIHGHAIQAAGFTENEETGETAEDMAWKAFEAQNTVNS